jgi:hypothetical protein
VDARFTPVLQTQVYSFAALLFVYLLDTWLGSLRYRRDLARARVLPTAQLIAWLTVSATLPVVMNDPRVLPQAANDILDTISGLRRRAVEAAAPAALRGTKSRYAWTGATLAHTRRRYPLGLRSASRGGVRREAAW